MRAQTFTIVTVLSIISVLSLLLTIRIYSPSIISVQSISYIVLKGELYTITANALSYASRGGDFVYFLNDELRDSSIIYLPVSKAIVRDVLIKNGISECSVVYYTPFGEYSFKLYLRASIVSKKYYYDNMSNQYVYELKILVTCDQGYPKEISLNSTVQFHSGYYYSRVYLKNTKRFIIVIKDWRGIQTYLRITS